MDDLEDAFEAIIDIEDIAEEIFEPDELLEDLIEDPLEIIASLAVVLFGGLTILLILLVLLLLLIASGPLAILATFAGLTMFVTIISIGAFIYLRTNIPNHVETKINNALEQADTQQHEKENLTEKEAIEKVREQYISGEITEQELEESIDQILEHEKKPEETIKQHSKSYN